MITLLIGGLVILWVLKFGLHEIGKHIFTEESVSETDVSL